MGGSPAGPRQDLLRLATAGSVDDGKSTLIGRLLFESKALMQDQLDAVVTASRHHNGGSGNGHVDLSLITDGLRAEREQGITIDVAYRHFETPRRRFIIADTPGHVRYTRNMVTGASTADVAVILVDARKGMVQQTRRHAFLSSLLGIPHLVVCVNKMDLVDWDEGVFESIAAEFRSFAARLDVTDIAFIPVSALLGDNVVRPSAELRWYEGPPLLYHLEHVYVAADANLVDVRFPVQWVIRVDDDTRRDYRSYAGSVAAGVLRAGEEIVVLPSGARTRVAAIETYDGPLPEATPPMAVALRLEDELDVSRGDVICRPGNRPVVGRTVDALICWMSDRPLVPKQRVLLKHLTRTAHAEIREVRYRIDVDTLHRDTTADGLELNEIGRVEIVTSAPLAYDDYRLNRCTGSFILIDEASNDTLAAGMIRVMHAEAVERSQDARSANVTWDPGSLSRAERWTAVDSRGAVLWLTGLPASGKSTLAAALERRLVMSGRPAYRLDGDNLRHGLNGNLGFAPADRAENVRRTAHVARLFADAGVVAIVSLVSPYAADREAARAAVREWELPFFEIHVETPLAECERRDPRGLYAKARRGELHGMTGIDDPYEPPRRPCLRLRPLQHDFEHQVGQLLALVEDLADRAVI